ncbi:MAG: hypothetical protein PHW25_17445 [Zoogloea sp.]|uniref:hypothetical protein n=1 Tax=Zoogloea sp. TaxID=49181 RepID=UPI002610E270|nr:hypothetical protein [Zoogloea sp.]MDD3328869.1 hypothetical protein [Zoogloea sp.]
MSLLAHAAMASGFEKNVEGMKGFYSYWLESLTPKDQAIIAEFDKMCREAHAEFARMLKEQDAKP